MKNNPEYEIIADKLIQNVFIEENHIHMTEVISKEAFIKCYKEWIEKGENK